MHSHIWGVLPGLGCTLMSAQAKCAYFVSSKQKKVYTALNNLKTMSTEMKTDERNKGQKKGNNMTWKNCVQWLSRSERLGMSDMRTASNSGKRPCKSRFKCCMSTLKNKHCWSCVENNSTASTATSSHR